MLLLSTPPHATFILWFHPGFLIFKHHNIPIKTQPLLSRKKQHTISETVYTFFTIMKPLKIFQETETIKLCSMLLLCSNLWTHMNNLFVSVRRESHCSHTVQYGASMLFYRCPLFPCAAAQALKKQLKQDILLELHRAPLLICCSR